MNKYNNKQDEQSAKEALIAFVIIACVMIMVNYVTM